MQLPDDRVLKFFYNVSHSVGAGGSNKYFDVLLVQYFLKKVYKALKTVRPPAGDIPTNGICDRVTKAWIWQYQKDLKRIHVQGGVFVDGLIDRARAPISSISKTTYTIIHLNRSMKGHYPQYFDLQQLDPDIPHELRLLMLQLLLPHFI
ncbi:MAG: hypothetical protein HYS04_00445 [Acidobacteria bacterium]|nr:hypothetical protein [Acidobacteriota bacterium]